jgi:LDH2 family malate/lactate/ureidoglycolate dehydrogenase
VDASEARGRLRTLGFSEPDAETLADHFLEADRVGKATHGTARIGWLERLEGLRPDAQPRRVVAEECFEQWDADGVFGYLALAAICDAQLERPPARSRVVVASPCFPTGMLGYWVRRLANQGLASLVTANGPVHLTHPAGGPALAGTNPLALGIPSSRGEPVVADVSMGKVTWGHVLFGLAPHDDLVPFGGEQAHKAFALAVGIQLWVEALAGRTPGAVLVVARPESDPVPSLRELANGVRLPGDAYRAT